MEYILNVLNDIEEEIKAKITQGDESFYALKIFFKRSIVRIRTNRELTDTFGAEAIIGTSRPYDCCRKAKKALEKNFDDTKATDKEIDTLCGRESEAIGRDVAERGDNGVSQN